MKTASTEIKSQPMVLSPHPSPPEAMPPEAVARGRRTSRAGGERRAPARKKRPPEKSSGTAAGELVLRAQAALSSIWLTVATVLRPLRLRCAPRRLRVMETLSLGNKQTLSLVRVDGQELLIAGTGNAVSLLAMLDSNQDLPAELADVKHLVASFYSKAP